MRRRGRAQQVGHRRALVDEHPDVLLRLGQPQGAVERLQRSRYVAPRLSRQCLQDQDLEDRARPAAGLGRVQESVEELDRVVEGPLGALSAELLEQRPGQGDVLELAQVGQLVVHRQSLAARPVADVVQPALPDPDPRLQRRDRADPGREVPDVHPVRLVEQVERAVEVSLGLADPGHGDPPPVAVLRQSLVLAELLARAAGPGARLPGRRARGGRRSSRRACRRSRAATGAPWPATSPRAFS